MIFDGIRKSLRLKLILASVIVEVVMLCLLIANSVRLVNNATVNHMRINLNQISPMISASLGPLLFQRDFASVNDVLDDLFVNPEYGIVYISVYDDLNQHYATKGKTDITIFPSLSEALKNVGLSEIIYSQIPLTLSGRKVGTAKFVISNAHLFRSKVSIVKQSLLIAGTEILLTILLLSTLGFFLTRHIGSLLSGVKNISEGDYSTKIEITSKDEIGTLANSFNQMASDIKSRTNLLKKSEEKYRLLFNSVNDSIFVHQPSADGTPRRFIEVNETACQVYGYTREEILELTPVSLIVSEEVSQIPTMIKKVFTDGQNVFETYHTTKKGKRFPVEVSAFLSKIDGEPTVLTIVRDITERKRGEEDLRQAHKMEALGTLAGGIAHDFNNVLSSIIGFTELALKDAGQGTAQEDRLQEVYQAGKRAKDLVWQILTFARQTDEPTKPINVGAITKEVLQFIRSSIPATIEIKSNIESDSLIVGNPTQIHQIIMNLCTNAAHSMDESGGILEVGLKDVMIHRTSTQIYGGLTPGNYVRIQVSDSGVGIPPEVVGSIFEPYFTTKAIGEGSGMGLAVVQGIVNKYGGIITVESETGKGSSFRVFLPITTNKRIEDQHVQNHPPTGTERILFIDDEAAIAKISALQLEDLGYTVTTRTSSVEALGLFRDKPNTFDLIITDMTMPNMTGDILALELMKIKPDIPIILCTGYSKKISPNTAAEIGIKAFVYKPIIRTDLAKEVRKVLDEAKIQHYRTSSKI